MLLRRFYDPADGRIEVDGTDIRDYRLNDYRQALATVLPESAIFSGTIADNLRYGKPDVSEDDVEIAARSVGLHGFVAELPDGYETRLGRGGITLEAEQLARLGFARALLTRPAILTIDDTFATVEESVE
jgi:ATP-binding cassette subfamily B protein